MKAARFLASTLAAAALVLGTTSVRAVDPAAVPSTYVVKRGDRVLSIAKQHRHANATLNQMAYAIIRANPDAFERRSVDVLAVNTKLVIPDEATVMAIDAKTADDEMAKLATSDERYRQGVALEKQGDTNGALQAYLDAAKLGHPLAQLRLGQLYDKDPSRKVPHDLQLSIENYQKARQQGFMREPPEQRTPSASTLTKP